MFALCIKNYIASLKQFFCALGILFLALLIGGHALWNGTVNNYNNMTSEIKVAAGDHSLSPDDIGNAIRIEWKDMIKKSSDLDFDGDKFIELSDIQQVTALTIGNAISKTVDGYADHISEISGIVGKHFSSQEKIIVLFALMQLLGIMVARSVVMIFCRAEVGNRNPLRVFFVGLCNDIFLFVMVSVIIALLLIMPIVGIALAVIYPIIYCLTSLLVANLSAARKRRIKLNKLFSAGNVITILMVNGIALIIPAVLSFVIAKYFSMFIALYINVALAIIASVVVVVNSDSIVVRMIRAHEHMAKENIEETEEK